MVVGTLVGGSLYRGDYCGGSFFRGEFARGECMQGGQLPGEVSSRGVSLVPGKLQEMPQQCLVICF